MELDVTVHFDFDGKKPVLVGLAIQSFGWILGGSRSGQLVLKTTMPISGEIVDSDDSSLLTKLQKAIKNFDYHKNGHQCFTVGRQDDE